MTSGVNDPFSSRLALEQALASKLQELLGGIPWLHDTRVEHISGKASTRFDLSVRLRLPGGDVTLDVECKSEMRPRAFGVFAAVKLPPSEPGLIPAPVLAMPFVSSRLADLCVQHGWSWYDLGGNCHIEVPGAIYLERRGQAPPYHPPRPKANLGTPEAGRVIRALLAPENARKRWTQRDMEAHFGELRIPKPSLGLVNKVVQHLRDEAFIEISGDGGFRLRDPLKLLFEWRDAYRFDRHERSGCFTLLRGRQLQDALYKLELETGGLAAYAAFSAADFQAPHVRQAKTWIYVRQDYIPRFEALTEAKTVETGENLVLLIPDDDGVFYMCEGGQVGDRRLACTNVVQTYVDVFNSRGRGEEAAEALLEQRLKPEWNRSGLL